MKKIVLGLIMVLTILFSFSSCNSCSNKAPEVNLEDTVVVIQPVDLNVERIISLDRQEMFINHSKDYRWFETAMKLNDFIDADGNDGSLEEVVNVFQAVKERGNGADVKVYKFQHFANGTIAKDSVDGFWIEDEPLEEEAIVLTYAEAFERLMQANIVKPHSCYCTLRKPVGPIDCNPQYVFGNIRETVFVDAVTGDVTSYNPAFGPNFSKPLGEWP